MGSVWASSLGMDSEAQRDRKMLPLPAREQEPISLRKSKGSSGAELLLCYKPQIEMNSTHRSFQHTQAQGQLLPGEQEAPPPPSDRLAPGGLHSSATTLGAHAGAPHRSL